MPEKPIIFNTEMVRAILNGIKTQTRRPIKPQPFYDDFNNSWYWRHAKKSHFINLEPILLQKSPWQIGDHLWVRETWCHVAGTLEDNNGFPVQVIYKTDDDPTDPQGYWAWQVKWRPSIHMPKWAARIWLEITGVRVERIQDITEINATAEGFEGPDPPAWFQFIEFWDSIYEKRGYGHLGNPWVWVIEFKRRIDG